MATAYIVIQTDNRQAKDERSNLIVLCVLRCQPRAVDDRSTTLCHLPHLSPVDQSIPHIGLAIMDACDILQVDPTDR